MLWLSAILFSVAVLLILRKLGPKYEATVLQWETEQVKVIRSGLQKEFLRIDPRLLKNRSRYLLVLGLAASVITRSVLPILVAAGIALAVPPLFLAWIRTKRREKFLKQFFRSLPQISSVLHAGHTFERALESLAKTQPNPLAQEFQLILKELRLGAPMETALENLYERFPNRDLEIVIRAAGISRRVGSNLGEALDRVSEMVRIRADLRNKLSSLTAQGRAQAWIAIAMPLLLTASLQWIAPGYLDPLTGTRIGRILIGISIIAMSLGAIWIHRISRGELIR